ncbi:TIGR03067 domain-containing protein [Rariglobus hedericola]|uniref:TIGR03067 domain-containing protein n=1 Tax=Rariglobus hedericola TaxID=2597822 RepID=A0A556QQ56_9BACT|nr:TIGR03067 domain-containing protein [Rariglobus hedericola]TSJ78761.1 TIGR03067 domain-containing protein [Rariglobus hedericola]
MSLHGKWRPVRAELDGEHAPELALERMELHLAVTTYAVHFAGEVHDRGDVVYTETTITLNGKHGEQAGRVIPAIYQLAGDRLRICYGLDGTTPAEFKTQTGSARYLVTYRRQAE